MENAWTVQYWGAGNSRQSTSWRNRQQSILRSIRYHRHAGVCVRGAVSSSRLTQTSDSYKLNSLQAPARRKQTKLKIKNVKNQAHRAWQTPTRCGTASRLRVLQARRAYALAYDCLSEYSIHDTACFGTRHRTV